MAKPVRMLPAALGLLALYACVQVYPKPETAAPAAVAAGTPGGPAKPDEKKEPFKPWDDVLKDTRPVDGFFKTYVSRDLSLFVEVRPDQLDKDFGMVMEFSRGVGDLELHQGLPLSDTKLLRLRRVGDQVLLVQMNPRFTADSGTPLRLSMSGNVGNSVLAAFKIESENKETKSLLINVTLFLVSDFADIGNYLKFFFNDRPASFDQQKSVLGRVQGFPKNLEIDAELSYRSPDFPSDGAPTITDYRAIPVGVRYSIFALPDIPMRPRWGDDRVGYFLDAVYDFSRVQKDSPFRTMVNRWRLEKKDPKAEISEPVQPIVYYVDRSVPLEYRKYVKEGIEAWNKGFEAAGFKNAIVAKDAPDDSTWSAEDIRYSTVRWTAGYQMGYAIGPSQTDPRTGEILNADVLLSSIFPRGWTFEYQELVSPAKMRAYFDRNALTPILERPYMADRLCQAEMGMAYQLGIEHAMLLGLGVIADSTPPESYIGDAIRDLVMHEIGHTLGLRHNFKSSAGIPYEKLQDTSFTRKNGLTVSVMDYNAVNVSADPKKQGFYANPEVGAYDVWAIQYGYSTVYDQPLIGPLVTSGTAVTTADGELVGLQKIARRSAEPLLTYGTDEDNWLGPYAVDPNTNAWDLSSDPLRWGKDRISILDRITPILNQRLISDGNGYQRLRRAITGVLFDRLNSLLPVTRTVGGIYTARDHKGDPNERAAFTPIPIERQRAAVKLISDELFAEKAMQFDPALLNRLAPNRTSHWGTGFATVPVDFPVHDYVATMQELMLGTLLDPGRLMRMIDNEARAPQGQPAYTVAELMQTLNDAIWSELDTPGHPRSVNSFRRNLQRVHIDRLTALVHPGKLFYSPEDARSLARWQLSRLSERLAMAETAATAAGLDLTTRAHFAESRARVDRALNASITLTPME